MSFSNELKIIIVNYQSWGSALKCIHSVLSNEIALQHQIVVVDNCSRDDSLTKIGGAFPFVELVNAEQNRGFSAGVNLGAERCRSKYILLLNPDTYFGENSIINALSLMESSSEVGIVGLDLKNPDGSRQFSARRFYSLLDVFARRSPLFTNFMKARIDRHLMVQQWSKNAPFEAEWVMGTGMVVRRDLFDEIGRMDEGYFLYMEDVDLCARVWKAGRKVVSLPGCELFHEHQRSSAKNPFGRHTLTHISSLVRFARKFHVSIFRQPGIFRTIGR